MDNGRTERVRVLIADDHPVFRDGVANAINARPDLALVGQVADGRRALAAIRADRPDVAVLDVQMPELGGIDVLHAITRDAIATRVVLLSAHIDADIVYRAIAKGVGGYISKASSRQLICDTVLQVARGETVFCQEVHTGLAREIQIREQVQPLVLSTREREVLVLTADGHSAPDVARRLHLSQSTVKSHLKSLYDKLDVSDRAAAVAVAMRKGLLE